MKLPFGFEIGRRKQLPLSAMDYGYGYTPGSGGWWPIREPYTGAWQRNEYIPRDAAFANSTLYRCITLIASDIAKMDVMLMQEDANGIEVETTSSAFSPVLAKPNNYQTRIQFFEHWLTTKLTSGNAYILKGRDGRNVVTSLYILDPFRTKPLVAPDGDVFYELKKDDLSGLHEATITMPASEIIHDRMNALFHPLVGLSPLFAANLPASQAIRIQRYSDKFFGNAARPSGVLTAPGMINKDTAERLKAHWEQNYTAENAGRVAVLGDGLKFEIMQQNAVDSQLIEQLNKTAADVCTAFGVPGYKVGISPAPALTNNLEALNQEYYNGTLQTHIENIELLLEEGLELPSGFCVEFDLDGLLRMDTATLTSTLTESVKAGIRSPNEAREDLGLGPVQGGESPLAQQQMWTLEALANRPAAPASPAPPQPQQGQPPQPANQNQQAAALAALRKELAHAHG